MKNLELGNNWLKIVYFAAGYGFVVSMLYLFGYWSTFGINILEYIEISDVIRLSIYPAITSVGMFVVGYAIGVFTSHWLAKKLIPFPGFKALILWILIATLPPLAFANGKLRGFRILEGGNCFYVNISTFKDKGLFQDQKRLKYLGIGGDFMFFLSEDNAKLYILEPSKIPGLELYKTKSQTKVETIKETKNETSESGKNIETKW